MIRWPSSIRARLTLWYTVLVGLPLIAFAVVCYVAFAGALLSRTDRFISDALVAFSREVVAERRFNASVVMAMQVTVSEMRFRELHIVTMDSAWNVIAMALPRSDGPEATRLTGSDDRAMAAALRHHEPGSTVALTLPSAEGDYRVIAHPLSLGGRTYSVVGRYPLREARETMLRIRQMFWVAIPLLLVFAATSGSFLAKRSLEPVGAMAAQAAEITASNLHERLPVSGGEELVGLAQVVNDLLDRLERSFEQQRRFMADASHELRTPTAVVRSEADITLSREHRTEAEYRDAIAVMQDASRRLTRIVDDLFLLARADSGHQVVRMAPVYLEEVVDDATRAVRPLADRRGVRIDVNQLDESPFRGDADLLGRLVLNLLDNAIKHSPAAATVAVRLGRSNGAYELTVADRGAGIPLELQHRIFDRFYRVDSARSREDESATSGAGLGLSIARWIAEVHGGRLDLAESRPGHTEFRLILPA
jgi:heavy metal sensor kinase